MRLRSAAGRLADRQPSEPTRRDFGSTSAAVLAIFWARGSVFALRQLPSGFSGAPAPLRDSTHVCWDWIAPLGATNTRAESELAGHPQIRPLYHTPKRHLLEGADAQKPGLLGHRGSF
eukprot:COSAG02_NODE_756_length_17532_cov_5.673550_11_plen_118_part_00